MQQFQIWSVPCLLCFDLHCTMISDVECGTYKSFDFSLRNDLIVQGFQIWSVLCLLFFDFYVQRFQIWSVLCLLCLDFHRATISDLECGSY